MNDENALIRALESGNVGEARLSSTRAGEWLAVRADQVRNTLQAAIDAVDAQGSPTACLLPVHAGARRVHLFLVGAVPLAWVRALDVLKF